MGFLADGPPTPEASARRGQDGQPNVTDDAQHLFPPGVQRAVALKPRALRFAPTPEDGAVPPGKILYQNAVNGAQRVANAARRMIPEAALSRNAQGEGRAQRTPGGREAVGGNRSVDSGPAGAEGKAQPTAIGAGASPAQDEGSTTSPQGEGAPPAAADRPLKTFHVRAFSSRGADEAGTNARRVQEHLFQVQARDQAEAEALGRKQIADAGRDVHGIKAREAAPAPNPGTPIDSTTLTGSQRTLSAGVISVAKGNRALFAALGIERPALAETQARSGLEMTPESVLRLDPRKMEADLAAVRTQRPGANRGRYARETNVISAGRIYRPDEAIGAGLELPSEYMSYMQSPDGADFAFAKDRETALKVLSIFFWRRTLK